MQPQQKPQHLNYFYCFKFYKAAPFVYYPLSIAVIDEFSRQPPFHAIIRETWEAAPESERAGFEEAFKLAGEEPVFMTRKQIADHLLNKVIHAAQKVELWSFQDIHCRHFFAELFGGMDGNAYVNFSQKGIEILLPRDMQHLYVGLGRPNIRPQEAENKFDALRTALWGLGAFNEMRGLAKHQMVRSTPITHDPQGLVRVFHDGEYWRLAPFVLKPLSVGLVRQDGTTFHGVFSDHVDELMSKHDSFLTEHEGWLIRNVIPKLQDNVDCVGTAEEIMQGVLDFIPECDVLELWSDHDNHDRRNLGCMEQDGWGFFSKIRDLKAGAVLPRDLKHLLAYMSWPDCPEQDRATLHSALHDAIQNKRVFDFLRQLALKQRIHPDPILPPAFPPQPAPLPQL